jgi:6-phosphofructokinase 1
MLKGNAIIGQSGGPTPVINASLAGVVSEAGKCKNITGVYGMRYGIEGFLQENIIDLRKEGKDIVSKLKITPSSALGSCRLKLKQEHLDPIRRLLEKFNIRFIFMIGGNDTMDTIQKVEDYCKSTGYELQGIGIPKTVDNDLFGTDHTPGFPSAGRYVAMSVLQGGLLAKDMKKVDQFVIYQAVGRKAGWQQRKAKKIRRILYLCRNAFSRPINSLRILKPATRNTAGSPSLAAKVSRMQTARRSRQAGLPTSSPMLSLAPWEEHPRQ